MYFISLNFWVNTILFKEGDENMKKIATLAGGCFWCMIKPYTAYDGVEKVVVGYCGGDKENPTYEEVVRGNTGHYESFQVYFDDEKITYMDILNIFWKNIDPFDDGGQFVDRGNQYRTAIFYSDDEQKIESENSKKDLEEKYGKKVYTEIIKLENFYEAEDKHQNYYIKNEGHYNMYYKRSGRYNFVKSYWDRNNVDREKLKSRLTDIQFEVTQNDMTEVPFENEYNANFERGIYVDIVDGKPLFSSTDKFESGCGWPAFSKPIIDTNVMERADYSLGMQRIEVRSLNANSHLGHVFEDGPEELGGMRYCINSASVRFVPFDDMDKEGYSDYKKYVK